MKQSAAKQFEDFLENWPFRNRWLYSTAWEFFYFMPLFVLFRQDFFRVNEYGPAAVAAAYWLAVFFLSGIVALVLMVAVVVRTVIEMGYEPAMIELHALKDQLDEKRCERTGSFVAYLLDFGRRLLYPFAWGFLTAYLVLR